MAYYTTITKSFVCPYLKMNVWLTGKYQLSDSTQNPYEAKFKSAVCSITENSHKPIYEQTENEKYLRCPNSSCKYSDEFDRIIDLRKQGY